MFCSFTEIRNLDRTQIGLLLLLPVLSIFQGGREIVGLAIYQTISLLLFYQTSNKTQFFKTPLDKPLILLLFLSACSTVYSMITQFRGLIHFFTLLIHFLNFYMLVRIINDRFSKVFIEILIVLSAIMSSVIGWQSLFGNSYTLFFPNANLLSIFLACGITALFCRTIWPEKNNFTSTLFSLYSSFTNYLLITILLFALLSLFSRGALIALSCGMIFLLVVDWKKILMPFLICIAISMSLIIIAPRFMSNFVTKLRTASEDSRTIIWKTSIKAFLQKPAAGWGIGSFGQVYQLNKLPIETDIARYEKTTRFAHNEWLELLVEMGLVGLIAGCGLIFIILKEWILFLKNQTIDQWLKFSVTTCVLIILIHSFLDFNFHLSIIAFLFVFFCALIVKTNMINTVEPTNQIGINSWKKFSMNGAVLLWIAINITAIVSSCFAKMGEIKKNKELLSDANFYFRIAATLNPFDSETLKQLALLSEPNEQIKVFKKAIRFNPGNDELYALLARTYIMQTRFEEAIKQYQNAIRKNPKNTFYYCEIAEIYLRQNQPHLALAFYKKATEIEPFYVSAHYRIGEILSVLGQKTKAATAFENVQKIQAMNLAPNTNYSKRLIDFEHIPIKK